MLWIILAGIELVVIIVLAIILVKNGFTQNKIIDKASSIAEGTLNVDDIKLSSDRGSAGVVAGAFNSIKNNLLTFIESTKNNVVTLTDAVNKLSGSVDANNEGNNQIAQGAATVAEKTSEQFEIVKDNLSLIESNNAQMQEINAAIAVIEGTLEKVTLNSQEGLTKLDGYKEDMSVVSEDLTKINGILNEFNSEIAKIEEIGDFIIDINEQLILLALNASIEAARAGEAGRGFAVVAGQMNEMSVKTKEGMDSINGILQEIIASSKQVNSSIKNCSDTYAKSQSTFELVNTSFKAINEQNQDIQGKMEEISAKFEIMAQNSEESRDMAQNLYKTSEAINEKSEDIANVSEQVSLESKKVGDYATELGGMLKGIQRLLVQFNTAIRPVNRRPSSPIKILAISMLDNDFWYGVRRGVNYAKTELSELPVEIIYEGIVPHDAWGEELGKKIDDLVAHGLSGIVYPGFMDSIMPNLQNAVAKGVKIFTYNCDCPASLKHLACYAPDNADQARSAARTVVDFLDKRGSVVMLESDMGIGSNKLRADAFKEVLDDYRGIEILDEVAIGDSPDDVYAKTKAAIQRNSGAEIIYVISGYLDAAAKAVVDSGALGRVRLVGFDHTPAIFEYIKKGAILAAVGQDAFGQGHDSIVYLYNYLVTGEPLPSTMITCRATVIDSSNVDNVVG